MLLSVLLMLAVLLVLSRINTRAAVADAERARLQRQAAAIADNLTRQLGGAHAALLGLRRDLPGWPEAQRMAIASERILALCDAMPGVRSMHLLDAQGQARASSVPQVVGRQFGDSETFRRVRAQPDDAMLYVSAPAQLTPRVYTLNLLMALREPKGGFAGTVAATLDPEYFSSALGSALYARDMRSAVIHGDGRVLLFSPPGGRPPGMALAGTASVFQHHLDRHAEASLLEGPLLPGDAPQLTVLRTLSAPALAMDKPLVLALGRDLGALWAPWRRQTAIYSALAVLGSASAWLALCAIQRRRDEVDRLARRTQARQAADAQRLALALRGADLGLWDAHLPSHTGVVNERWYTMLGYDPGEVASDEQGWRALLHPDDSERVLAAQAEHLQGRSAAYEAAYRLRHKDGHWVWVLDRGRVVERDAGGQPLRMVGTHLDITERMHAEQALRRSEELLATTLHSIGEGVITTDPQGRITRLNKAAERLTGWPAVQALGRPLAEVYRVHDAQTRAPAPDRVTQALAAGNVVAGASGAVLVARDGRDTPVAESAAPIRVDGGDVLGVVVVCSDIGSHLRMVQALRLSERRLRTLLDALLAGVVVHDADTRVIDANPAACRILGLSLEQMSGKAAVDPAWRFLEEDRTPMAPERFPVQQVRATGLPLASLIGGVQRPGLAHPLWVLCNAFPVFDDAGAVAQIVVTFVDITERKLAEEELARNAASLRMTSRIARLGGWRFDAATQQLTLSPESAALLALDAARPRTLADGLTLVAPAERDAWRERLSACLREGLPFDGEFDAATDGVGAGLQLRLLGEPVRDGGGRIVAVQGALQDVTESRRAQQQLRLLDAAVSHLNDAVIITEAEPLAEPGPRIVFVNEAFERLTGWRREEVLGRSPRLLQGDETSRTELDRIGAALARHQPVRAELVNVRRDGRTYWVEVEIVPLLDAGGRMTHLVAVERDITERRESEVERRALERQLAEAQKMESIGTLAGGVAHDFNNILAGILGNVALARADLPTAHPAQASLEQIGRAGLRARSLVQQILAFSRRQATPLVVQPLRSAVEEALALLRATLPASVRLDAVLSDTPLAVQADATQLQQVLMNLCTNAWHALPGGRGRVEVGLEPEDGQAHLWVRDNGKGMDEATRERIFDPFFTTKPVGQGTGLGLSVVHGIVRAHGGTITVESALGQGSTFHLRLPLAAAAGADADGAGTPLPAPAGEGRRVLYVDDDEVMVIMVERLLERIGWQVAVCHDAGHALALVTADPARFEVVVTDYNMPEMSGLELAAQLLRLRPGLAVVITSGYIADSLGPQASAIGVRALMRKENTLEELPALLLRVLAG